MPMNSHIFYPKASVAELVDAHDSKSCSFRARVRFPPLVLYANLMKFFFKLFTITFLCCFLQNGFSHETQEAGILQKLSEIGISKIWKLPEKEKLKALSPKNLIIVAKEITKLSQNASAKSSEINLYLDYIRAGYYYQYYSPEKYPYTSKEHAFTREAMKSLAQSPFLFEFNNRSSFNLRSSWVTALDSTLSMTECLEEVKKILEYYSLHLEEILDSNEYYTFKSLIYNLNRGMGWSSARLSWYDVQKEKERWEREMNAQAFPSLLFTLLEEVAQKEEERNSELFQQLSGIIAILSKINPSTSEKIDTFLSNYSGKIRFVLLSELQENNVNLPQIDYQREKEIFIKTLFPEERSTDKFKVFKKITIHHAFGNIYNIGYLQEIFASLYEIEKMFLKLCPFTDPVPKDRNEELIIRIQKNPKLYEQYQMSLFNVSEKNGGIYIEKRGTIYTFDRKQKENLFTLNELMRHEFVHALDSRMNIVGDYGESGTLYDIVQTNFAWYIEGLAEALAGTYDGKILPRLTFLHRMNNLSIAEIVSSGYEKGFSFYSDAGLLFCFLAEEYPEIIANLMKVIRKNDIQEFLKVTESFKNHPTIQQEYNAYIEDLKKLPKESLKFYENIDSLRYGEKFYQQTN